MFQPAAVTRDWLLGLVGCNWVPLIMNRRDNGENEIFQYWLLNNKSAEHFVIKGKKPQINELQD